MSEVEQFWYAVQKHTGDTRKWEELPPQAQSIFIQGINMILAVVNSK